MTEFLKIALPNVSAALAAALAYYFGRRKTIDDIKIKRGLELAEEISTLFQEIAEFYDHFFKFYNINYGHIEDIRVAADSFANTTSMFETEHNYIRSTNDKKEKLKDLIRKARIYLNTNVLDDILFYLSIGEFEWHYDSIGFVNTYAENFFKNLMNAELLKKRNELKDSLMITLPKLIK